jgi:hypothetical protein
LSALALVALAAAGLAAEVLLEAMLDAAEPGEP